MSVTTAMEGGRFCVRRENASHAQRIRRINTKMPPTPPATPAISGTKSRASVDADAPNKDDDDEKNVAEDVGEEDEDEAGDDESDEVDVVEDDDDDEEEPLADGAGVGDGVGFGVGVGVGAGVGHAPPAMMLVADEQGTAFSWHLSPQNWQERLVNARSTHCTQML